MAFDFRLHTVTYSEVDSNGFIGIQFDAFGEEQSGMPTVEVHHPFGFRSRPRDPDADFGCNVLVGWEGHQAHAWLASDPRYTRVLPSDKEGGSTQYGVTKHGDVAVSFSTFDGETGGYTLYVPEFKQVPVTDDSGLPVLQTVVSGAYCVTVDPKTRAIQMIHPDGFAMMLTKDGIQMRGDDSTWLKLGKGVFEVVAAQISLRGIVALGADTSAAVPLLPSLSSQPTPSVFFSPV